MALYTQANTTTEWPSYEARIRSVISLTRTSHEKRLFWIQSRNGSEPQEKEKEKEKENEEADEERMIRTNVALKS